MTVNNLIKEIRKLKNPQKAKAYVWFFKTGKGEYGEGDKFLGLVMAQQHQLAKKYVDLELPSLVKLLQSSWHEERMIGLLILVYKYKKADIKQQKEIFNFYIKYRKAANNWDLIDVTVPKTIGVYLVDKDKAILYKYAKSKDLWERRIAVLATFPLIKSGNFNDNFKIAKILLHDEHDLIHKAVGWMLREVGKKDMKALEEFIKPIYKKMPRTMLRYALEKLPKDKYNKYLKGEI